jgi:hypothetical protein
VRLFLERYIRILPRLVFAARLVEYTPFGESVSWCRFIALASTNKSRSSNVVGCVVSRQRH